MKGFREPYRRPRWEWVRHGGARLFAADGAEYTFADQLVRVEVERLLTLDELDAVRIECGGGVESWVSPADARRLWLEVESDLEGVEGWQPSGGAPGTRPYRAELHHDEQDEAQGDEPEDESHPPDQAHLKPPAQEREGGTDHQGHEAEDADRRQGPPSVREAMTTPQRRIFNLVRLDRATH